MAWWENAAAFGIMVSRVWRSMNPKESKAEIRVLDGNHAETWWRLRLERLEQEPEAFGQSAAEHCAMAVEEVARRLNAASVENYVLGALIGSELAGTVGFVREKGEKGRHKGTVWGMFVVPAHRGKGVGRELMSELLRRARALPDLEMLMLRVSETQSAATALYESLGFKAFGREPGALKVSGRSIDELHMALRLR